MKSVTWNDFYRKRNLKRLWPSWLYTKILFGHKVSEKVKQIRKRKEEKRRRKLCTRYTKKWGAYLKDSEAWVQFNSHHKWVPGPLIAINGSPPASSTFPEMFLLPAAFPYKRQMRHGLSMCRKAYLVLIGVYKGRYWCVITPNGWKCSCLRHLGVWCLIIGDHFQLFGWKSRA